MTYRFLLWCVCRFFLFRPAAHDDIFRQKTFTPTVDTRSGYRVILAKGGRLLRFSSQTVCGENAETGHFHPTRNSNIFASGVFQTLNVVNILFYRKRKRVERVTAMVKTKDYRAGKKSSSRLVYCTRARYRFPMDKYIIIFSGTDSFPGSRVQYEWPTIRVALYLLSNCCFVHYII